MARFMTAFAGVIAVTKDLPDIAGDLATGVPTLATKFGSGGGRGGYCVAGELYDSNCPRRRRSFQTAPMVGSHALAGFLPELPPSASGRRGSAWPARSLALLLEPLCELASVSWGFALGSSLSPRTGESGPTEGAFSEVTRAGCARARVAGCLHTRRRAAFVARAPSEAQEKAHRDATAPTAKGAPGQPSGAPQAKSPPKTFEDANTPNVPSDENDAASSPRGGVEEG